MVAGSLLGLLITTSMVPLFPPVSTLTDDGGISLATQDGLVLTFDTQTLKFSGLEMPGYAIDLSILPDLGVYLYDHTGAVLLDPSAVPVEDYQMIGGSLHLTREETAAGIRTEEVWMARQKHIELETTITDIGETPISRAIEACVQLPLDFVGKHWHHHLHQSEIIQPRSEPYETLLTRLVDIGSFGDGSHHMKSDLDFNLHGLNLIGDDDFGLAMAVHPQKPAAYYVMYDPGRTSYDACFHLGIYEDHLENQDSVTFNLAFFFPDDPEWGLRSALEKYVSIYPQSFLGELKRQAGMVVGGEYDYSEYPDPGEFHIGAMWNGFKADNADNDVYSLVYLWPTGFSDRAMRLTASSVPNGLDESWEADVAACLSLYRDYDRGQNPFEETCTGTPPFTQCAQTNLEGFTYGPVYKAEDFYDVQAFQAAISNCPNYLLGSFEMCEPFSSSLLQNETGGHVDAMSFASAMFESSWGANYRCFFNGFNPDPGLEVSPSSLPSPGTAPTQTLNFGHLNLEIAKRANGLHGAAYLYEDPGEGLSLFNGAAVDTVGSYLRQDFNPDMLRVATLTLGHDTGSGEVVALEHLGLFSFLRALRASLPPEAAASINGYPISGILGQDIDFFMAEMSRRKRDGDWIDELYDEDLQTRLRRIHRIRMSAYQRPITFWAVFDRAGTEQELLEQMRRYLALYTSKGIYINPYRYGYQKERYFWHEEPQSQDVIQEYIEHVDAVHALTTVGWEPVPFAKPFDQSGSSVPEVLVERFGPGLFTLYNGGDQTVNFNVEIDWKRTGAPPAWVRDWQTGSTLPFTVSGSTLTVSGLSLGGRAVQIVEVQSLTVYLPRVLR